MAADSDTRFVELRGKCPRGIVDVLDAVSTARCIDRTELVNEVLNAWARRVIHQANVVANVTRGNPPLADIPRGELE